MVRKIRYDHINGPEFYFLDEASEDPFYRKVVGPWGVLSFTGYISDIARSEGSIELVFDNRLRNRVAADSSQPAAARSRNNSI